jgi:hypothetical protein
MGFQRTKTLSFKREGICIVIILITSLILVLTVSFHDYLPAHPPASLLLAGDKAKNVCKAGTFVKWKLNPKTDGFFSIFTKYSFCQTASIRQAFAYSVIILGMTKHIREFSALFADLSPPSS